MDLMELLRERKAQVAERWIEEVYRTYPLDTAGFLRKGGDRFLNPVGHRTAQALGTLLDMLLEGGVDPETATAPLDDLIRVRSVQDFRPSQAVGVVYLLKTIVRDMVNKEAPDDPLPLELLQFESKVDTLALVAFDVYTTCRDAIFEMRTKETKNRYSMLLRRAGMICDMPAEDPDNTTK